MSPDRAVRSRAPLRDQNDGRQRLRSWLAEGVRTASLALLLAAGCAPPRAVDIGAAANGLSVCPKGAVIHGVDVSHYEGAIDWQKAKAGAIDFAFLKATESTNYVDPTFATNWRDAGQSGVIRGAYHFFRASVDAATQADYFIQNAGAPAPGDLPLTLDLEVLDGVTAAQVTEGALTFLARVAQKTGRTPIVYTSPSFYASTLGAPAGFEPYVLWIANWQTQCPSIPAPAWSDWKFWQTSDSGSAAGVTGTTDVDDFNGSLSDLQHFVNPLPVASDGGVDLSPPGLVDAAPREDAAGAGGGADGALIPVHQAGGCSFSSDAAASVPAPLCLALAGLVAAARLRRRNAR